MVMHKNLSEKTSLFSQNNVTFSFNELFIIVTFKIIFYKRLDNEDNTRQWRIITNEKSNE